MIEFDNVSLERVPRGTHLLRAGDRVAEAKDWRHVPFCSVMRGQEMRGSLLEPFLVLIVIESQGLYE